MFVRYFRLLLDKKLQGLGRQRHEREARTLVGDSGRPVREIEGCTMTAMMLVLGRLEAVEVSLDQEAGG